jgi:hypothetical protein
MWGTWDQTEHWLELPLALARYGLSMLNNTLKTISDEEAQHVHEVASLAVEAAWQALSRANLGIPTRDEVATLAAALVRRGI